MECDVRHITEIVNDIADRHKEDNREIFDELKKLEVPINYYNILFGRPEFTEFIKDYERKISNLLPPISD